MDDIITAHCDRRVVSPLNIKFMRNDVIKRTHGFDYERNFRRMLINLIGIITCEKLEGKIPAAVHAKFIAELNALKIARDSHAHTYLKGLAATFSIDAPSVTKARFFHIYAGLKEFETGLRSL